MRTKTGVSYHQATLLAAYYSSLPGRLSRILPKEKIALIDQIAAKVAKAFKYAGLKKRQTRRAVTRLCLEHHFMNSAHFRSVMAKVRRES